MDLLPKLASVFALAFVSFWTSFPAGAALGLAPLLVALTAWISYSLGVILTVLLGEPLRARLLKRFGGKIAANPRSPIRRAWDRFGLVGLSLLAPVTVGSQTGALIGLSFGAPPRRLMIGMVIGGAVWAALITGALILGLGALR